MKEPEELTWDCQSKEDGFCNLPIGTCKMCGEPPRLPLPQQGIRLFLNWLCDRDLDTFSDWQDFEQHVKSKFIVEDIREYRESYVPCLELYRFIHEWENGKRNASLEKELRENFIIKIQPYYYIMTAKNT